jgi:hypothetical protein
MPWIGEIKYDHEIGRQRIKCEKYIWLACLDCNVERWVKLDDSQKQNFTGLCHSCCLRQRNGKLSNSPNWKGGIKKVRGYVFVLLAPGHTYYSMADQNGYIKRSRLIMAEHFNRRLTTDEEVHHIDLSRDNDTLSNLALLSKRDHLLIHRNIEKQLYGILPRDSIGKFIGGFSYANQKY